MKQLYLVILFPTISNHVVYNSSFPRTRNKINEISISYKFPYEKNVLNLGTKYVRLGFFKLGRPLRSFEFFVLYCRLGPSLMDSSLPVPSWNQLQQDQDKTVRPRPILKLTHHGSVMNPQPLYGAV